MATLALGAIGAVAGSFFGPLGTSIGWALGAGIGNWISQKGGQSDGPRLTDLRVLNSSYGAPIPIGYGTKRIAGNVIDQSDLIPHEHKSKSGGKGGSKATTNTTYSINACVELASTSYLDSTGALVNAPIKRIKRIWADSRLIFGEGSPGDTLPMTVYYGTEDQMPDPTFEAMRGAGNVPAYRGKAYVVFADWDLSPYGNRIPSLTFEVQFSGAVELEYYALWGVDFSFATDSSAHSYPYDLNGVDSSVADQLTIHRYRSGNDYSSWPVPSPGNDDHVAYYESKTFDLHGSELSSVPQVTIPLGQFMFSHVAIYGSMNSGHAYARWQQVVSTDSGPQTMNTFAWLKDGVVTYSPNYPLDGRGINREQGVYNLLYWNGYLYTVTESGTNFNYIKRYPAPDGSCYVEDPDISFDLYDYVRGGAGTHGEDLFIGADGFLYCRVTGDGATLGGSVFKLLKFDAELNLIAAWYTPHALGSFNKFFGTPGHSSAVVWNGYYITYVFGGVFDISHSVYCMHRMATELSDWTFIDEIVAEPVYDSDSPPSSSLTSALVHIASTDLAAFRGGILTIGNDYITLGEIVADVSQRVGYAPTQYDVTQLTDIVKGYVLAERMTGRSAIDALRPTYQFGAVESNLKVKFRKWKGEVDTAIDVDDLGAKPFGDDIVDLEEITRVLEAELPQSIDFVFCNPEMDYQDGHVIRQRMVTESELHIVVTAPIVLTSTEAARACQILLDNAWVERNKSKFQLPYKYAYVEPTDVVSVRGVARRIVNREEQGYTHLVFDGVAAITGVFVTQPAEAPPLGFVPQPVPVPNNTDTLILGTPLIDDSDSQVGFNVAMAGRKSGVWPSAVLFKSVDGGVEYDEIADSSTPASMGVALSVLGDWTGGNVIDTMNNVQVRLGPGSPGLSSTTELGLLSGANMCALGSATAGWEIFQFQNADVVSADTYELSTLLRGRRGSEQLTGGHFIGDKFVLLPVLNVVGSGAELGEERLYKGITSGRLLSSETAIAFTNTGVALKCYAPTDLGGGRDGSGNLTLNWTRRTRIGGSWQDNVDVPLSEDNEWYNVYIYLDNTYSTIVRIEFVTTGPTFEYTTAMQTADFGSLQSTVYFGVVQIGAYGNGYEARGDA